MGTWQPTRRAFIRLAGALGLGGVAGCGVIPFRLPFLNVDHGVRAFKRSGRGRRVSNAAKKHNANHVYATFEAAAGDPAHPGDRSKVVPITMNRRLFEKLFADGRLAADLRHDL